MNKTIILLILIILPFICVNLPLGSVHCMTVVGNSMEPTITHNDIVVFTSPEKQLKVGDIISYKYLVENTEYIIAHRIVSITDEGYKTKGDSLNYEDNYIVTSEDVTGIMLFKIPSIVAIGHFANTFTGYVILILLPGTILIIMEVKKIKSQEIKK